MLHALKYACQMQPTLHDGPLASTDPASAEEAVVMLLMQAGRRLRTRHREDQVDPSCFPLAKVLLHHLDGMRVSDLAAKLQLDASTVSRQIKQLQDKGLLERTPDPADGRASLVQLSEHGQAVMHAGFKRRLERIQSVLDTWDDADREQLRVLLARLATDLSNASDSAFDEAAAPISTRESN
jgi:DNA-binding MarR family transcriptional regulator